MLNLRPVLYILGILLCIIAVFMLLPAYADAYSSHNDYYSFLLSAAFTFFVGACLVLANKQTKIILNLRQAFLLVPLSWTVISAFAALPLYFSELNLRYIQALLEAVSALTTTGATVIVGLDTAPPGILLWRALMQWVGGVGIIGFGIIILPMLGIGGMQFFKGESADSSEKILPRVTQVAKVIIFIYILLTSTCAIAYWLFGMNAFDAICHAMTTVSTAGLANYDSSFGYFNNVLIEVTAIIFMCAGAIPFLVYYKASTKGFSQFWKDSQIRWFFYILGGAILMLTAWLCIMQPSNPELLSNGKFSPWLALRHSAFNLTSLMTTTGYATADYGLWGGFSMAVFFFVMFIGGCSGSSAGGLKVFRVQILFETAKSQIHRLINPHGIFKPQYNHKNIPDSIVTSVLSFSFLFVVTFAVVVALLAATGVDFVTATSTAVATLANAGPGFGAIAGPSGNYSSFGDATLLVYCLSMLIGRVEIFVFIVLFSPHFWRS